MIKVEEVRSLSDYILALKFTDGLEGELSIESRLFGIMFEPLKDPEYFSKVSIDDFGVVCWPNEADLATDVLYNKVLENKKEAG